MTYTNDAQREELAHMIAGRSAIGGADSILAAGYRKQRVISTVEELKALPGGVTIRDRQGATWQRYLKVMSEPVWFPATRDHGFHYDSNMEDGGRLPVTVLWEPPSRAAGMRVMTDVRDGGMTIQAGEHRPRKFWEYRESDGTTTNRRVVFLGVLVLAYATLGFVVALIGGFSTLWPIIPVAAALAALGAFIAHAIDYVHDRKAGMK